MSPYEHITPEREQELRAYLASINPDAPSDEIDSIDLAIFDCGGCNQ